MGSYFGVRLPAGTPGAIDLACRALDLIDQLEDQLTVYRDDSEVSRLNACAHAGPVEVERKLFDLLEQAIALSRETAGAYDVTAGALSEAWGFVRGPRRVPDPAALAEARECTGWHHLRLDPVRRTVAFDRAGVQINLGSIGKGYALGSPPGTLAGRWEIAVRNPFDASSPLGTIRLRNRGLGTSGTVFQQFVVDGKAYGHLIDPRTGEPAEGPASVTVAAPTAALADALSTAFYLLGAEAAHAYAERHPEIGVVIVNEGPSARSPRVTVVGLSESDFAVAENTVN
jgi:thiamine biosynthesis lipoprotein